MKKVIGIALVLLLGCSMMAFADANTWVISVNAADQNGSNFTDTLIGWVDGFTDQADVDLGEATDPNGANPGSDLVTVVSWLDANTSSISDYRAPATGMAFPKVYTLSTYYQRNATLAADYTTAINVTLTQLADYAFPYEIPGIQMTLEYIDAQGTLQTKKFDANNPLDTFTWQARLKDTKSFEDWDARLTVDVPEPGSMLALGSGLVGLMGFALRRRS